MRNKILQTFVWMSAILIGVSFSTPAFAFRTPEPTPDTPKGQRILEARDFEKPPGSYEAAKILAIDLGTSLGTKKEAILKAVLNYLKGHPNFFKEIANGLPLESFEFTYFGATPKNIYLEFYQKREGLKVEPTSVRFFLKQLPNGNLRLMFVRSLLYPEIQLPPTNQKVETSKLQTKAREALGVSPTAKLSKEEYVIRYLDSKWRVIYQTRTEEKIGWAAMLDALTGKILGVIEERFYDEPPYVTGHVNGRSVEFDPLATGENLDMLPLGDLHAQTTSGSETFTDAEGAFQFPQETSPTTVLTSLSGRWADVHSAISPTLSLNADLQPGVPYSFLFNPQGAPEDPTAQVNGYYHTTKIHNYLKNILGNALPGLDIPIPVTVNIQESCNAYYTRSNPSINFYHAAGGCINTAYDTIIYHEYGHFLDDMAGGLFSGTQGRGLSEGWGDLLGCYTSGRPFSGEGFRGPGTTERTCDNNYRYLILYGFVKIHDLGQAWSGFAWHLRDLLIQNYGMPEGIQIAENLLLPVVLANSESIPEAVWDTVLADDDDGILENGTPHLSQIAQAAARHDLFPFRDMPAATITDPFWDGAMFNWQPNTPVVVPIRGTADTSSIVPFGGYQLFYGEGIDPTTWHAINQSVAEPVTNGELGTWNYCGAEGNYALKLVVKDASERLLFQDLRRVHFLQPQDLGRPIVTENFGNIQELAISGHRVVWADNHDGNSDVYVYDLLTNQKRQITNAPQFQEAPSISGNLIVWEDFRNGNADIYLYDLSTNQERQLTNNSDAQISPSISGNRVVWVNYHDGNADIYLYDLSTNQERRITTNPAVQYNPSISGDKIVWEDERSDIADVYLYDLAANQERPIATARRIQKDPVISGNRIVWTDERNGYAGIYLYDLSTNQERRITNDLAPKFKPSISGDLIVWTDQRNGNSDIYLYDLSTNKERRLTSNSGPQYLPAVSANQIVWLDRAQSSIVLYDANERPPEFQPVRDQTITAEQNLNFDVSIINSNEGLIALSAYLACAPVENLGASFTDHGNGSGTFSWTPRVDQAGVYHVNFTASNETLTDLASVTIIVEGTQNHPPTIERVRNQKVHVGEKLVFNVIARDPDGIPPRLQVLGLLPEGATFTIEPPFEKATTVGRFEWEPMSKGDLGNHLVKFEASDGEASVSIKVTISVV